MSIKICSAALDETPNGDIILRGVLDPSSLHQLLVADYQREVLPISSISTLAMAFEEGAAVPDVDLGMRGQRVREQGGCFYLQDDVYIVDGLQRVNGGLLCIQRGGSPRLGATVHFGTNEEWERDRFRILNADRTKLSSNILLRNMRHKVAVVDMLYRLTNNSSFVLGGRVAWNQRMLRQELLTAMTFLRVVGMLHSHLGPTRGSRYDDLAHGLDKVMASTGQEVMRDNIRTYFDLIDECWGVKRIAFKEGAVYMRGNFLLALAKLLSGHLDFWREDRLFVETSLKRKLAQFPVSDPQVQGLSSSSGKSRDLLLLLMIEHINSGKRSRRLTPRTSFELETVDEDEAIA